MSCYDEYFKKHGLRNMPDAQELAEIIELLMCGAELNDRQKTIVEAITE